MECLTVAELDALATLPGGLDDLAGTPIIEVTAGLRVPELLAERLAGLPAVLVASPEAPDQLRQVVDVVVDADASVELEGAVAANPQASVALAVLVRGQARRTVLDDLVAESATYALLQAGSEHQAWLAWRPAPKRRPEPTTPSVVMERDGDLLHVLIDRPEARNAFDVSVRDGLLDALAVAAADPAVQVTIGGAGPAFCAGGDLVEFGTTPDPATAHLVRLRRSVGRALAAVADRTTVVVHGACVGAGVELPAFARRVVARPDAVFRLPEVSMGLVPGAGGTASIPRRIGRQRFLWLALSGREIDVTTALEWGLVDEMEQGIA